MAVVCFFVFGVISCSYIARKLYRGFSRHALGALSEEDVFVMNTDLMFATPPKRFLDHRSQLLYWGLRIHEAEVQYRRRVNDSGCVLTKTQRLHRNARASREHLDLLPPASRYWSLFSSKVDLYKTLPGAFFQSVINAEKYIGRR